MTKRWMITMMLSCIAGMAFASGNVVREIEVRTVDAFATDTSDVLVVIGTKVGDSFDQVQRNKDVQALLATQRFSDVNIDVVPLADGVRLIYVIKRRYTFVGPMELVGVDYFSQSKIEDWAKISDGMLVDDQIMAAKCDMIRREYQKRYFPATKATAEIFPVATNSPQATVRITVVEGRRLKPGEYDFVGNQRIPDDDLRATFDERPWWDPRGWFSTSPYNPQQLDDARQHALDAYLDAGYLDAKISPAEMKPLDSDHARIAFRVTEGVQYTVSGMKLTGAKTYPEKQLLDIVTAKIHIGDIASRKKIQETAKAVRDFYFSHGYVDAVVHPSTVPDAQSASVVTLYFDVKEGEEVHIRNVVIRGNSKTRDKVIRREIHVSPGQVMDEVRIERDENRLKNLGYFDKESGVRHSTSPNSGDSRDLVFDVTETSTASMHIGGGYSSIDGLVGIFSLQQGNFDILNWPNFTGGGQKAKLDVEVGAKMQSYDLSWTEPWFLDYPMSLTVDLFRRQNTYPDNIYRITHTGADVGLMYPVAVGKIGFTYTADWIGVNDALTNQYYCTWNGQPFSFTEDETPATFNSMFETAWIYDTRNQMFVPTAGTRAKIFGNIAGQYLGSDADVYHVGAEWQHWEPLWWNHVFSLRGRVETVANYDGETAVPVYDRLFLGGARTVRGLRWRDVGPKVVDNLADPTDQQPYGGLTLGMVSAEYTVPVVSYVRFATFSDAGTLHLDSFDTGSLMHDWAWTAGMGLRIDIPGFPLRFDYAWPIVRDEQLTRTERFSFLIGIE